MLIQYNCMEGLTWGSVIASFIGSSFLLMVLILCGWLSSWCMGRRKLGTLQCWFFPIGERWTNRVVVKNIKSGVHLQNLKWRVCLRAEVPPVSGRTTVYSYRDESLSYDERLLLPGAGDETEDQVVLCFQIEVNELREAIKLVITDKFGIATAKQVYYLLGRESIEFQLQFRPKLGWFFKHDVISWWSYSLNDVAEKVAPVTIAERDRFIQELKWNGAPDVLFEKLDTEKWQWRLGGFLLWEQEQSQKKGREIRLYLPQPKVIIREISTSV